MNILLCGASMGIGGAETHILSLAIALSERGHRVTVASERGELCEELKRAGVRFVRAPLSRSDVRSFRRSYLLLKKILLRWDFDVVHAHSRLSALIVSMIKQKEGLDFRFVVTAHAKYKTTRALRLLSVWGDRCIAVSRDIKSHLVKNYGVDYREVCVIPNGIDTKRFSPMHKGARHSILFVSRLDKDCSRGARLLCNIAPRLLKEFPDTTITIAGGGDDYGAVSFLAKRANALLGQQCITLSGKCSDMPSLIAKNSCVVGVSRVALESMAMEKPAILFGNEGALGLLNEKNLSRAVNTNFTCRGYGRGVGAEFLLSEIRKIFTMDDKSRTRLCRFGRSVVCEKYSLDNVADMTLKVYKFAPQKPPSILIGGYYGFGNIGDESVLSAIIDTLRKSMPTCHITALTNKGRTVKGIQVVNRRNVLKIIKAMRKSNVYISGGGSLFQNKTSNRSLAYYCGLLRLAKRLGNKCIILSNGIGPLHGKKAERMVARALSSAEHVSVRDMDSFLKVISLTGGDVWPLLSADPVFLNSTNEENEDRYLLSGGIRYAAISLKDKCDRENQILISTIKEICKKRRILPVFVPMDIKNDRCICKIAAAATGGILADVHDISGVERILKNAEIAIGERLHFLFFALKNHVPMVPISADPKIDSFSFELFGTGAIEISKKDSPSDISERIEKFIAENHERFDIEEQNITMEEFLTRAKKDMDAIRDICLCEKYNKGVEKSLNICYNNL